MNKILTIVETAIDVVVFVVFEIGGILFALGMFAGWAVWG